MVRLIEDISAFATCGVGGREARVERGLIVWRTYWENFNHGAYFSAIQGLLKCSKKMEQLETFSTLVVGVEQQRRIVYYRVFCHVLTCIISCQLSCVKGKLLSWVSA